MSKNVREIVIEYRIRKELIKKYKDRSSEKREKQGEGDSERRQLKRKIFRKKDRQM